MIEWTNGISTLYRADAREIPLPDASVHCVVTSPPYWGLRDYGLGQWQGGDAECGHQVPSRPALDVESGGGLWRAANAEGWPNGTCGICGAVNTPAGIGLEPTLGEWVEHIVEVMREVKRVLRDDGTCWLNLGDAYAGSWGNYGARKGGQRVRTSATFDRPAYDIHTAKPPGATMPDLAPKNLMGQPWRVVFGLQDDGWILRSAIVWHKPNPMPESARDRPTNAYEMVFLLVKSSTPQFWTHRDGQGTRTRPAPAYRWIDGSTAMEYESEPPDYSDEWITCSECEGSGEIVIEAGQVSMFDGVPGLVKDCGKCKGGGQVKRWKRINLWQSHDYFYDAEAIRQANTEGSIQRRQYVSNADPRRDESCQDSGITAWHHRNDRGQPMTGANARNVWTISTQGRSDAHFATFPDALPRRCILAGTSERGVCADCGAPWVRQVEKGYKGGHNVTHTPHAKAGAGPSRASNFSRDGMQVDGGYHTHTLGWQPTCGCGADVIRATVLDPFVGSGTTVAVAQALGRRGVGLDLNEVYLGIAAKYIGATVPLLEVSSG